MIARRSLLLVVILLLIPLCAQAKWALGDLFSDATLRYWQGRYPANIEWNFNNLILGKLTPAERQEIGDVQLKFPLRAPGAARNQPLQFFASGRSITVPILSVRFFDELTQAWAYLLSNGLDMQLPGDYLAMLKYRAPNQLGQTGFPAPLDAFGIPKDAWKFDPKMDDVSQKALKSAIVWILGHELGHIYYGHPGYGPGVTRQQAQANEMEADRFANRIMRRIGVAPVGMVQFFMALAHLDAGRGDFADDQAWQKFLQSQATHPLTSARLQALAADLRRSPSDFTTEESDQQAAIERIYYIAEQIEGISEILEDPEMHRLITAIGLATDPGSLQRRQRRIGQNNPNLCRGKQAASDFRGPHQGLYRRNLQDGKSEWLAVRMELQRSGNRVQGSYSFGAGEGTLNGVLAQGNKLYYDWQWGTAQGKGQLAIAADGVLRGQWGYNQQASGGGEWELCRQ